MALSDAARRDHDQLFGDRISTLARADPELIAHFDNFAGLGPVELKEIVHQAVP